ncbi:PadR family transcriptional regulator [Candidatus Izimaplasma bacterium]|nr:PadR family transcriptional regulator [Candidatus Izimaplasma bacterium]
MINRAQILKGLLEGCILEIISHGETYGYKITEKLNESGFTNVNEGSVYPVLIRLQKKEFVNSETKTSPLGPKRKYFTISEHGKDYLTSFKKEWKDVSGIVTDILKGGK